MRITEEANRIVSESSVKNFGYNLRSTKFNFFLINCFSIIYQTSEQLATKKVILSVKTQLERVITNARIYFVLQTRENIVVLAYMKVMLRVGDSQCLMVIKDGQFKPNYLTNITGYPKLEQPISAHENAYSLVWYILIAYLENYGVHLTPLPSGNFQRSDPPPPRNFRVPPWGRYGYFLELHIQYFTPYFKGTTCSFIIFVNHKLH